MESRFDFLTGVVHIDAPAPETWARKPVLPFWKTVEDDAYDPALPRLLIHETLHFWQLMWSGYLGRLVAEEWARLLALETTGELPAVSPSVERHNQKAEGLFAADELAEAWCRYWDVHIRGPLKVLDEEGIPRPPGPARDGMYSSQDFDTVMREGPSAELYARPYRWLLDRADGNTVICNAIFPFVIADAFLTDNPVGFFADAVEVLLTPDIANLIRAHANGAAINMAWIGLARPLLQDHLSPLLLDRVGGVTLRMGSDLLEAEPLASHPLLGPYAIKAARSNFKMWSAYFFPIEPEPPGYAERLAALAREAPVVAQHIMPGQPWYRMTLGALVPPPVIRFRNFAWHAPVVLNITIPHAGIGQVEYSAQGGVTFERDVVEVEDRVRRFRHAQQEVDLGLPIGALG